MQAFFSFGVAFVFSFIGTLPPGALNLTVIQLGLNRRTDTAIRVAVAAAIVEYPYAWVAVTCQEYIQRSVNFTSGLRLTGALLLIVLGIINLMSTFKPPGEAARRVRDSGFRMGIALGILNPLAIPFWIAMTAYMKSRGWVTLSNSVELHAYLFGIAMGTMVLLGLLALLSRRVVSEFNNSVLLPKLPGAVLILLGIYSFGEYMWG